MFRRHIVMARHGFGQGEYRYFAYPLPSLIQELRTAIYSHLAPLANDWNGRMGSDVRFPSTRAFAAGALMVWLSTTPPDGLA